MPPGYDAERRYAARVVLHDFLGLDVTFEAGDAVELTDGERTLRFADVLFRSPEHEWLAPASLPRTPLARLNGLPVIYGEPHVATGEIGIDIFGSAFFYLTRYEEVAIDARDARDRFPSSAALAVREGVDHRAIIDEYVELLRTSISEIWPRLTFRRSELRVLPSHDIDTTRSHLRYAATDIIRRLDPVLAARRLAGGNPSWSFDALMDDSERCGLRSAFYFIADSAGRPYAADYDLDDPRVIALLRRIHARGHEIGIHPSYLSYNEPARLRREVDALRVTLERAGIDQPEIGGRQHWLRWANPVTWRAWEDAGLAYDSTLGWSDRIGFRAGCCREYPVFDLLERRELRLRERPLIAMDSAATDVVGRPADGDLSALVAAKEACRRHGGDFTLLWHNEWLLSRTQRRLYRRVLES